LEESTVSGKEQGAALTPNQVQEILLRHLGAVLEYSTVTIQECEPIAADFNAALASPSSANEQAGGTVGLDHGEGATKRDWETDGPAWEKRAKEAESKLAANEQAGQEDLKRARKFLEVTDGYEYGAGSIFEADILKLAAEFAQVRQAALGSGRGLTAIQNLSTMDVTDANGHKVQWIRKRDVIAALASSAGGPK
jgi:hypothetical protein